MSERLAQHSTGETTEEHCQRMDGMTPQWVIWHMIEQHGLTRWIEKPPRWTAQRIWETHVRDHLGSWE